MSQSFKMKINLGEEKHFLLKIVLQFASLKCFSAFGLRSRSITSVRVLFFYAHGNIVRLEQIIRLWKATGSYTEKCAVKKPAVEFSACSGAEQVPKLHRTSSTDGVQQLKPCLWYWGSRAGPEDTCFRSLLWFC